MKQVTMAVQEKQPAQRWRPKDPGSAITHFIGMLMALFAAVPLLVKAAQNPEPAHMVSLAIFIASMFLLYMASTLYHSFDLSPRVNRFLKKMDHMMIFVMIAGSYTPICVVALGGTTGTVMLCLVWGMALAGILVKGAWINCPKWFSSVIYILMGWLCVLSFSQIWNALHGSAFFWLLAGGVLYTIGGVIYALKLTGFNARHKNFGTHEIFHLFVMAGSICHFIVMYQYIAAMPL